MNILIIGSGGREHALAWKLSQSANVKRLFIAPGNGGTATLDKATNVALGAGDLDALLDFAMENDVSLTVVGPEGPLVDGIVDLFESAGQRIFGPSRAAAQLEGSKAFAKQFMAQHGIPTAQSSLYQSYHDALVAVRSADTLPVIKLSGLAAGKGVYVPNTLHEAEIALREIFLEERFGHEHTVVIEERLHGPELSLLALCDGHRFHIMPAAQDHKRLLDGDKGPNTGGMGAYAPAPLATPELIAEVSRTVFAPTVAGMASWGAPYRGVLYAGLMITPTGPKVLEFNCRFGDPETQVLLPLLESDLVPLLTACASGSLAMMAPRWRSGAAATVVLAAPGYPDRYPKGSEITGVERATALPDVLVFHAGTDRHSDGTLVTDGGRVLAVTGLADTLLAALRRPYEGITHITFEGAQYRTDIGAQALSD